MAQNGCAFIYSMKYAWKYIFSKRCKTNLSFSFSSLSFIIYLSVLILSQKQWLSTSSSFILSSLYINSSLSTDSHFYHFHSRINQDITQGVYSISSSSLKVSKYFLTFNLLISVLNSQLFTCSVRIFFYGTERKLLITVFSVL